MYIDTSIVYTVANTAEHQAVPEGGFHPPTIIEVLAIHKGAGKKISF